MPAPRNRIRRGSNEIGELLDLPNHGQVCLHTRDPELVRVLEERGVLTPRRPPYLHAGHDGVRGAYRPTPQINYFFAPPLDSVVDALRSALEGTGCEIELAARAASGR